MVAVLRLDRVLGPRAVPLQRSVVLPNRRGAVGFRYAVGEPASYIFNTDIYAFGDNAHPHRHLGWWRFELPREHKEACLVMDFDPIRSDSVHVLVNENRLTAIESWHNPDYAFDPLGDLQLVVRQPSGEIRHLEPVLLKFPDREILRAFYARHYATNGYTSASDAPFLPELHRYKLQKLYDLFTRYVPAGGRAIDVGCGRSLFTEIEADFAFKVFAGDLNYDSVHARALEVPKQAWAVFDAAAVPFGDGQFDALFAGEVIEHVTDVRQTLREWWRVLKPGGVAIITTPNKERLVAVADGMESPYSRDHLNELSYRELTRKLLPETGFGHCQVDEKLVDRPPRYWAPARRERAMLGIRNSRQPQLDNTPRISRRPRLPARPVAGHPRPRLLLRLAQAGDPRPHLGRKLTRPGASSGSRPRARRRWVGRMLPISQPIAEALARRPARRDPDSPLVFHRDGITVRRWRTAWRTACQAAGVPTRFLHDCRRTAARNLIRASVPERVAMLLTGHKSRAIFDRYNIIHEQELLDAGDQLVAYLAQQAQAAPARRRPRPHVAGTAPSPTAPLRLVRRGTV